MNEDHPNVPRGIEVLVKKASIDPEFKELLISARAEAAAKIDLSLDPAEEMMLRAITDEQLAMSIAQASVPQQHRRAFLGKAAAAMLAAIGAVPAAAAFAGFKGGSGGIMADIPRDAPRDAPPDGPQRRHPDVGRVMETKVIQVLAKQLKLPAEQISWDKNLVKDLKIDDAKREAIRKALETSIGIPVPVATFRQFTTVEDAAYYVYVVHELRVWNDALAKRPIIEAIAKEMKIDRNRITGKMRLAKDLKMTTAQKASLKRKLATEFRVYLSWTQFKGLVTVNDVIDYVAEIIEKRRGAKQPSKKSKIPPGEMTFGNRPDMPIMGGSGGSRPGRPPKGP